MAYFTNYILTKSNHRLHTSILAMPSLYVFRFEILKLHPHVSKCVTFVIEGIGANN